MLQRLLLSLVLAWSFVGSVWASCPSRTYTYATGSVIDPGQVTTNEDSLFTYSCAVDTFADGSIATADLADNAVTSAKIAADTIVAADIAADAVGSSEIAADAVGTSEIAADAVTTAEVGFNYAGSASEGGAATTATALAANGANCAAGNYPLGVDASGAVESCTAAGGGASVLVMSANTASSSDNYVGVAMASTTETLADFFLPDAGTLDQMYCHTDAPAVGKNWAITLRDDAAGTSVTCTITDTATSCSDLVNSAVVAQGSLVDVFFDGTGTPDAANNHGCSFRFVPS